jgi:outer membrane protein OmpA-like peptidoglycan-associated protein
MREIKQKLFLTILILFSSALYAQKNYTLVERTDLRRYDNGIYKGLMSREVRSFISAARAPDGLRAGTDYAPDDTWYDGSFYVMEQMKHNAADVAAGIHDSVPAVFRIKSDGHLVMYEDNGYPSFRSFPAVSRTAQLKEGDSWTATGERAADPLNKGKVTRMPMEVKYDFIRNETYRGEKVYRLRASWATRYGALYTDPAGDPDLKSAQGSHSADIIVSCETLSAVLVRDSVAEEFTYADGNKIAFKGTITLFTEYPPAAPRDKLVPALQRIAEIEPGVNSAQRLQGDGSDNGTAGGLKEATPAQTDKTGSESLLAGDENHITVEDTGAGLRLSIQDLQFIPDSARLLPGENSRLDKIASVLKLAPDSQFLVEGHTASTGNPAGEMKLSQERAHAVASALAERGIPAGKFICRGYGAVKPVADNTTAEGKARNRRVEITILE